VEVLVLYQEGVNLKLSSICARYSMSWLHSLAGRHEMECKSRFPWQQGNIFQTLHLA